MKRTKFYALLFAIVFMFTVLCSASLSACVSSCDDTPDDSSTSTEATLTSITLDTTDCQLVFSYDEEFNYDGLKVTANYSDGTTQDVDLADCKVTTPSMTNPGTRNVTVTYSGQTARYQITVNEKVIPEISSVSMLSIEGENENEAYRMEAEDIDMETSGVTLADGYTSFVATAPEDATTVTSGNKYLTGYGVKYNYFGFTFTSDAEYEDVTLVLRMAYSGTDVLSLTDNLTMYLNYTDSENTGEISLSGYTVSGGTCEWADIVIRNVTIAEGTNTLTFEAYSDEVPDIDYIDFYVGMRYISSVVEISEQTTYIKDLEDFDTEKAYTRSDVAAAHGLSDGELYVESVTESPGKTTSGGTAVGAIGQGSQLSTTLRLAEDSTIKFSISAAKTDSGYYIADNWEFYIDGVKLENIERVNIMGGDSAAGYYWDWIITDLGSYNLSAGDHLFLVVVTGSDCNVDYLSFEVLSLGSYDESGVDIDNQGGEETEDPSEDPSEATSVTISGAGTYTIEAEDVYDNGLSEVTMRSDMTSFTETWTRGEDTGTCFKGYDTGSTLTFTVTVEQDCTITPYFMMSYYDNTTFDLTNFVVTFAGQTLTATASGDFGHDYDSDWWKWVQVNCTTIDVTAGEYTFSITLNATGANIDCFGFVVTTSSEDPGEDPSEDPTEPTTTYDLTISDVGTYTVEVEDVYDNDLSNVIMRSDMNSLTETWTRNEDTGTCFKGYDTGSVITFTVKVEQDCTITPYFMMSYYDSTTFDLTNFVVTFAGQTLTATASGDFGHDYEGDWWKWVQVNCTSVDVTAGEYTFSITLNATGTNLDCFGFVVTETVTTVTYDLTISGTGTYKVEAEDVYDNGLSEVTMRADMNSLTETWTRDEETGICFKGYASGSVITFTVYVEQDCTITPYFMMSYYDSTTFDFTNYVITFAGETLTATASGEFGHDSASDYWKWVQVNCTSVDVTAGVYTFSITLNAAGANFDYFGFTVTES